MLVAPIPPWQTSLAFPVHKLGCELLGNATAVVSGRFNYSAAAAAIVVYRRVRDQPSS